MREMKKETLFYLFILLAGIVFGLVFGAARAARGDTVPTITVDGVEYPSTKASGPVLHFETPDTDPQAAFTDRHVWAGNGSENLPCTGGIHWIDNENVLTVSHCIVADTTTTSTTVPSPTTTVPESSTSSPSTTTLPPASTSTVPSPTTTLPTDSTTTPESTSSTATPEVTPPTVTPTPPAGSPSEELPFTGPSGVAGLLAGAIVLAAGGVALLQRARGLTDGE